MIIAVVIIAVVPGVIPNRYILFVIALGAVYLLPVLGLNLLLSGGAVSLGTSAFMLIGAYSVALLQVKADINAIVGIIVGMVVCAFLGLVTSLPALRLGTFAVAVVTLMYASTVAALALHFKSLTGGGLGVPAMASPLAPSRMWLVVAFCGLVAYILHRNLVRSPMGRALMMTRRSEPVAGTLGISPARYKVGVFTLYAVFSGIAGGLYQQLNGPVGINTFGIAISLSLLLMVVLGGATSVVGPFFGVVVLTVVNLVQGQVSGSGGGVADLFYGAFLLVVVLVFPKGLAGVRVPMWVRQRARFGGGDAEAAAEPINIQAMRALLPDYREDPGGELDVRDIERAVGGLRILRGISMRVRSGEICGLIGPNGSGKTTLLNCINGLDPMEGGSVVFGGKVVGKASRERAMRGIGRSFQTVVLAEDKSVRENMTVGFDVHRSARYFSYALRLPPAVKEARASRDAVRRWADALGLGSKLDKDASTLTPRERRLLEVGRALVARPRLLLLDEPIAGLTGGEVDELVEIVRTLKEAGIGVILVEHHAELVMSLCDTVTVLDSGEVAASGEPESVRRDPKVIAAYLGDTFHESRASD